MKRTIFLIVFILGLVPCIFAQNENKMSVALGPEWNMNSRNNFAGGIGLSFDYNLPKPFAIGITVTTSNNFNGISVTENTALFRWYFLGEDHSGFFAQVDLGAFIIFEAEETTPLFLGGLKAGYRLFLEESVYIEPYGRLGYPFVFGIGITAGITF